MVKITKRKIIITFMLVVVIILLALNIYIINLFNNELNRDSHYPYWRNPSYYALTYEEISFTSRDDNVKLKGWFINSNSKLDLIDGNNATIVIVHGRDGNMGGPNLDFSIKLHDAGFNIFLIDLRNHGESEDKKPYAEGVYESKDVLGAIDYLRTRLDIDINRIGVWGWSLGGMTIVFAGGEDGRLGDNYIKAAVVDSIPASWESTIRKNLDEDNRPSLLYPFLRFGYNIAGGPKVDDIIYSYQVADMTAPIFIINGKNDKDIYAEDIDVLFEASNKKSSQMWLTEFGHINTFFSIPDEYSLRVIEFFNNNL